MSYYINLSFLSNKHDNRQLSAEARRILSLCEGISEDDIAKEEGGRPFLPDRDADFSISHSGNLAAVSVIKGKNTRTGCDVELVRPRAKAREITEIFFSSREREYIEAQGKFDMNRFYQIWMLKECYLKLRGESVFDMAKAPSFIPGEGSLAFCAAVSSPLSFSLFELTNIAGEQYILASALAGTEAQPPEIRWFSQESLDCKSIANKDIIQPQTKNQNKSRG